MYFYRLRFRDRGGVEVVDIPAHSAADAITQWEVGIRATRGFDKRYLPYLISIKPSYVGEEIQDDEVIARDQYHFK